MSAPVAAQRERIRFEKVQRGPRPTGVVGSVRRRIYWVCLELTPAMLSTPLEITGYALAHFLLLSVLVWVFGNTFGRALSAVARAAGGGDAFAYLNEGHNVTSAPGTAFRVLRVASS